MSTDETRSVFDHHAAMLLKGDVDGVLEDYTEDSVLISSFGGVVRGLAGLRAVFESPIDLNGFELTGMEAEGDVLFVTWRSDTIPFATDTFVVRDGKIAAQTVAVHAG